MKVIDEWTFLLTLISSLLPPSLEQRDAELAALQQSYAAANADLGRWRGAFKGNLILPGLAVAGGEPDPTVVVQEMLKMEVQHSRLREQVGCHSYRRRCKSRQIGI